MTRLDEAATMSVVEAATRLGLTIGPGGHSFGPCPSCGEATRASRGRSKDPRGRCRIIPGGQAWLCCSNGSDGCGARGDSLRLAAWVALGRPQFSGREETDRVLDALGSMAEPVPIPVTAPAKVLPPVAEVRAVWAATVRFDARAAVYLQGRGLTGAGRVCTGGAPWAEGWEGRLLFPLFDTQGVMRSLVARACWPTQVKSMTPRGYSAAGLVLCNRKARDMLRGDAPARLVICEGEIDLLTWTQFAPTSAVMAVRSGSWRPEFATWCPAGKTIVCMDADDAGDKYAAKVMKDIPTARHARGDANDVLQAEGVAGLVALLKGATRCEALGR